MIQEQSHIPFRRLVTIMIVVKEANPDINLRFIYLFYFIFNFKICWRLFLKVWGEVGGRNRMVLPDLKYQKHL